MPDELPSESSVTPLGADLTAPPSSGLTPNVAAGLAALVPLLGGVVLLVIEKRDRFVRFWAMQTLFFGVAWLVFSVATGFIGVVLASIFVPLFWLWRLACGIVYLGILILWIISIVQAFQGKEWEIPVLGKLARQQLAKVPPAV